MDARNPFDTSKQPFRLNQFGGNIGGPIIRNRTFFFANYEGLQQRVSQTLTNDVPSAAFRARATNPPSNTCGVVSDRHRAHLNADIDRVRVNRSQRWQENAGTLRIDHRFNENNTIFGRYNVDNGITVSPRSVIDLDTTNDAFRPSNFVMQYQRIFTPTVINEVKAGFNRSTLNRVTTGPLPNIAVAGFTTLNQSNQLIEAGTSYSINDNLVINRGAHTIKVGGEVRRAHVNVADPAMDSFSVSRMPTVRASSTTAWRTVSITRGAPVLGTRKWYYFAFVQDDWKIRPNLTLNLGVRYEYYGVNREVNDRYRVFDMSCGGFCPHGTPWYFPDKNNFDPRVGLAWSLGKTVIRTGAGVYHGPGQIDDVNASLDNLERPLQPHRVGSAGPIVPDHSFPRPSQSVGVTPRSLQRDRRDLYSIQWGFSVQRELPVQFVGQAGTTLVRA
jgi:outer membrane receptor protein involved in Fe transport